MIQNKQVDCVSNVVPEYIDYFILTTGIPVFLIVKFIK